MASVDDTVGAKIWLPNPQLPPAGRRIVEVDGSLEEDADHRGADRLDRLEAVDIWPGPVPTKTHILNLLRRLIDGKITKVATDAPQALSLHREPKANVERYDRLRGKELRHAS